MDIEQVVARAEIEDVLMRYVRGADRCDLDLMRGVFWPEAIEDHGPYVGPVMDYLERVVAREGAVKEVGEHHITNIYHRIEGDDAWVEATFLAFHPHSDDNGVDYTPVDPEVGARYLAVLSGRYLQHMTRRDGEWRILHRKVVQDWTRHHLPGDIWRRASWQEGGFPHGGRADDPSYEFFAEADNGCSTL